MIEGTEARIGEWPAAAACHGKLVTVAAAAAAAAGFRATGKSCRRRRRRLRVFFLKEAVLMTRMELPFFGKAVLMMELPRRYSTPSGGGRFAPI